MFATGRPDIAPRAGKSRMRSATCSALARLSAIACRLSALADRLVPLPRWKADGTTDRTCDALRAQVRAAAGRPESRPRLSSTPVGPRRRYRAQGEQGLR